MTDSLTRTIGWIGAGRMGSAMVGRLLAAGHSVSVYNRTRAKAEPLAERGATIVDTIAELAGCDVVFTTVAASADLEQVLLGEGGLLRQQEVPRILIDSSTVSSETSAKVRAIAAERGSSLLAAPVSGNAKVAKAGKLTLVVSGPEDAYHEVAGLLAVLGRGVTYAGDGELARLVKIAHNVFLGVVAQSLAEITVLAEKGGVKRSAFLAFLNDSVMGSTFTRYKAPAYVNLDFTPTFTTKLLRKDLELGLDEAKELGTPMPLANVAYQLAQAAILDGHGDVDFAALLLQQARAAGLDIQPEDVEIDDGLSS
jgi:3-hydroxyisobutyrate dehydrogenase-like beta-hydroxyacid dehydrogenase